MPSLSITTVSPSTTSAEVLLLGVLTGADGPVVIGADSLPGTLHELSAAARSIGATGRLEQVQRIPTFGAIRAASIVLVGLGEDALEKVAAEDVRRAFGAAARRLAGTGHVAVHLPGDDERVIAAAEGTLLGAYAFTAHRGAGAEVEAPVAQVEVLADRPQAKRLRDAGVRAEIVAGAVHGARDLVNTPPNLLFPAEFAERAQSLAKGTRVSVEVLDERDLDAGGYGGILGVGQGSTRPPRLVKLSYRPSRPAQHVALVGKGITFDSGGVSLKPGKGMHEMTSDMAGAATVLHTVLAAARLRLPVRVTAFLALAENMPGGGAQRPGDVVTMRDGSTVAVLNTDAEGRLVMADALTDAAALSPDLLIDVATLTGAQEVALGLRTAGVMGTAAGREAITAAADDSGELFWPMPFPAELRAELDSPVADLQNIGSTGKGGMLVAGVFLREFVGECEWAHLDVAGPAYIGSGPWGYHGVGGTGMGLRTLLQVMQDLSEQAA